MMPDTPPPPPPSLTPAGSLFRKYAAVLATLVAVAVAASGAIGMYSSYRDGQAALMAIQREKAAAAAAAIERFVAGIEGQIGWVSQTFALPGQDSIEQRHLDYIRLLRHAPAITELRWLDQDGRERLAVSRIDMDVVESGRDRSTDPSFVEASAKRAYRSPVYFRKGSEPYMTIAVGANRRSAGVTIAEVNLKLIWDVISAIRVGEAGRAYVVDAQGRLIAHPDISLVLRRTDLSAWPQVRAALAGDDSSAGVVPGPEGRSVLSAHSEIVPLRWTVFVDLPAAEAFGPIYASLWRTAGLILAGTALAVAAAMVLARRLTVPIRAVKDGAARIGHGDLAHRIDVRTGDELETLAGEFNHMAERLQESYSTLEQRVADRTFELSEALERLRALAAVSEAVNSSLELETVLGTILGHACAMTEAGGGAIYVLDDASGALELAATHGIDDELVEALRAQPIRLGESVVGRCVEERDAVQLPELAREPDGPLQAILTRAGARAALLSVPLLREGEVIGALLVRRERAGPFTGATVDLLKSFAVQSALAISNARLFRELERKGRQLEAASRHKSQFLANMSHELRTPMNAILGFTELVLGGVYGEPPSRIRGVHERIKANGKHLLGLINDVLDLSKIEAGQLRPNLGDYALSDVLRSVLSGAEPLAAAKNLALRLETAANGLPRGRGDAQRLAQVLLNLVSNAIKFTEEGEVVVSAEARDGEFRVAVADSGPGIPDEQQERIFDEFYQVDGSSTREKGGTGLGLAIAKRIVEMHEGRIWVESEPGKGARFCFTLAVRVGEAEGERHERAHPRGGGPGGQPDHLARPPDERRVRGPRGDDGRGGGAHGGRA